jgi:uncharacterized damage-inducible protein DinB
MSNSPAWFERTFDFTFPAHEYPKVCFRLRGTPARLEEIVRGAPRDMLTRKPGHKWSAQEHAGHLLDLEPLWTARAGDFLSDRIILAAADLTNRGTDEANHNARDIQEILAEFDAARRGLMDCAGAAPAEAFALTRTHPRLKQPMRLVDHLFFVAEHDDHHLAAIRNLLATRGR